MIPKVIHYCWFGGNPLTPLALKCIESWKKFCPDYEIREWNESNYDVNCCEYSKQAYKEKKWAFVSDVARYKILHDNGGLYFDVDVEIVRPINELLENSCFMGLERLSPALRNKEGVPCWLVNPGLAIGCEKGHAVIAKLLDEYNDRTFYKEDGSLNLETICTYTAEYLYKHGMKSENTHQNILGVHLYPKEFFNPMDSKTGTVSLTANAYSIHHYAASWTTNTAQRNVKLFRFLNALLGKRIGGLVRCFYRKLKGK